MDSHHAAGTGVGILAGLFKSFVTMQSLAMLTWGLAFDTAILAFIGGVIGWCASELMKLIKKKLKG